MNYVTHPIPLSEIEEDEVLKHLEKEYYDKDFDASTHELKVMIWNTFDVFREIIPT